MKTQFVICTFLLLGLLGIESLKEEQFKHLWSNILGHTLPVDASHGTHKDIKCPAKKEQESLARQSEKKDDTSLTCFLLYNPGKGKLLTCEKFEFNTPLHSNVF